MRGLRYLGGSLDVSAFTNSNSSQTANTTNTASTEEYNRATDETVQVCLVSAADAPLVIGPFHDPLDAKLDASSSLTVPLTVGNCVTFLKSDGALLVSTVNTTKGMMRL
jgi:hypothetical protein